MSNVDYRKKIPFGGRRNVRYATCSAVVCRWGTPNLSYCSVLLKEKRSLDFTRVYEGVGGDVLGKRLDVLY